MKLFVCLVTRESNRLNKTVSRTYIELAKDAEEMKQMANSHIEKLAPARDGYVTTYGPNCQEVPESTIRRAYLALD